MKAPLEKLLGPNWRTSSTGLVETAAIVVVAVISLPDEVWQDWRAVALAIFGIITKTVKDFQTKDKAVSGNASEGFTVAQKDGETKVIPPNP